MRKYVLCCDPVSVHPSVTLVDCIYTAEDIVKFLSRPCSPITSFLTLSTNTQFQGEPLQQGCKIQGVGKFCDFQRKSPSISEMVQDRPMVANER